MLYTTIGISTGTSGGIVDITPMAIKSAVTAMREAIADRFISPVSELVELLDRPAAVPVERFTFAPFELPGERLLSIADGRFAMDF